MTAGLAYFPTAQHVPADGGNKCRYPNALVKLNKAELSTHITSADCQDLDSGYQLI